MTPDKHVNYGSPLHTNRETFLIDVSFGDISVDKAKVMDQAYSCVTKLSLRWKGRYVESDEEWIQPNTNAQVIPRLTSKAIEEKRSWEDQ